MINQSTAERCRKYYYANRDRIIARQRAKAARLRALRGPVEPAEKSPHRQDALMRAKTREREARSIALRIANEQACARLRREIEQIRLSPVEHS